MYTLTLMITLLEFVCEDLAVQPTPPLPLPLENPSDPSTPSDPSDPSEPSNPSGPKGGAG